MALTEKRKLFADEYLIDLNASRAYRVAYPRVKDGDVAAAAASRLLKIEEVKKYVADQMEAIHNEKTADAQEVIAVMRGKSNAEEIVVEGIGDGCSEARAITKGPSEKERLKAAELLGKRYALFTDKVETDVDMDLNITIDYGEDDTG